MHYYLSNIAKSISDFLKILSLARVRLVKEVTESDNYYQM